MSDTIQTTARCPLVALGDSITWGYPGGPTTSWVRRVADDLGLEIANLGVNGDTLEAMRLRLGQVIDLAPTACVMTGGTNDAALGRPVADMAADIAAMAEGLTRAGIQPIIGMPPPVLDPIMARHLDGFRHFVNGLAGTRSLRVIPFDRAFFDGDGELIASLLVDATHPSLAGYEAMARLVMDRGTFEGI